MRESTFRETARRRFVEAFGEPERLARERPPMLRWTVPCDESRFGGNSAHIYLTVESADHHDEAHVLVSDPCKESSEPVYTLTIRSVDDLDKVIERIRQQVD